MTLQERQAAFVEAVKALEKRFGITFRAVTQPETLGEVIQIRSTLVLAAVPSWQEEAGQPAPTRENGK